MKRYIKASNASITKEDLEDNLSSLSDQFNNYARNYSEEAEEAYEDDDEYQYGYNVGMADAYRFSSRSVMNANKTSSTSMTEDDIYDVFVSLHNKFYNYAEEHYEEAKRIHENDSDYQHGYADGAAEAYDDISSYVMTVGDAVCGRKSKTSTKNSDNKPEPTKPKTAEDLTDNEIETELEQIVGKDYLVEINVWGECSYARIIKETSNTYTYKDIFPSLIPVAAMPRYDRITIKYLDIRYLDVEDDYDIEEINYNKCLDYVVRQLYGKGAEHTVSKEEFISMVEKPTYKSDINIIKIIRK